MFLDISQGIMTDKAEESAVGTEKQMKRHGEPKTSPPRKRRLNMAMLPVIPEEEGASQAGSSAMFLEEGEVACPPLSFLTCPSAT